MHNIATNRAEKRKEKTRFPSRGVRPGRSRWKYSPEAPPSGRVQVSAPRRSAVTRSARRPRAVSRQNPCLHQRSMRFFVEKIITHSPLCARRQRNFYRKWPAGGLQGRKRVYFFIPAAARRRNAGRRPPHGRRAPVPRMRCGRGPEQNLSPKPSRQDAWAAPPFLIHRCGPT